MPEVKILNVTKRYGTIIANDSIDLTLKDGEYVSVIGPSGCGKTTLIKNIAGIIQPDEGEIYIDGKLVNDLPIEDRGIGYVFQNIALFPHMSVWDNIIYGPRVRGFPPEEIRPLALEMLELIKLRERAEAFPAELSGGTQQKTAVARALTSRATLLLLDEPLGALDVKVRTELRHELRRLVKDLKLTAFHVTHDQEEAMSISDRVIVMKKGKIVEAGTPIELYIRPKNIFTANFVGEANFLTGIVTKLSDQGATIELDNGPPLLTTASNQTIEERVVLAFRPEFATIQDTGINKLEGTIRDIIFSGDIQRIKVQLTNRETITMKRTVDLNETMGQPGDTLTITISPRSLLVYPYPSGGLESELALE